MIKVPLLRLVASMALVSAGDLRAGPLIPVKTRSTALVFATDATNHLTQSYVGLASGAPATYNPASDNDSVVYPAAGGVFHAQPALRATHFDGNTSTDLVYVRHGTQDLGSGVTLTTITLKDSYYPFFVELRIRSYVPDDVFEEWVQVHHQEPAAVTLYEVASAALVVKAPSYSLRHYHRDQNHRLTASDTKLAPLLEFLKSVDGAATPRLTEPVFVVSLGSGAQSSEGAALGGALLTAGDFVNSFEYEEPDDVFPYRPVPVITRLRILGGTNPRSIPRTFLPGRNIVTSPMVFTYHDQGRQAAVARLHAWAQAHARKYEAGVKPLLDLPAAG
jgi:alpha-galactosidase